MIIIVYTGFWIPWTTVRSNQGQKRWRQIISRRQTDLTFYAGNFCINYILTTYCSASSAVWFDMVTGALSLYTGWTCMTTKFESTHNHNKIYMYITKSPKSSYPWTRFDGLMRPDWCVLNLADVQIWDNMTTKCINYCSLNWVGRLALSCLNQI